MSGKHFTLEDRINILMHVKQNHSMRMIATALNASASTVSRELKKHRILDEYSSFHSVTPTCSRIMKAPGYAMAVHVSLHVERESIATSLHRHIVLMNLLFIYLERRSEPGKKV